MAQSCALICDTCRLSASRSASGMLVAPERRMSCAVMTWIEAAACKSLWGSLATDVTSTFISSSPLRRLSSPAASACAVVSACACPACPSRRHVTKLATPGAPRTTAAVAFALAGRVFRVRSLDMDCLRHGPRIPQVDASVRIAHARWSLVRLGPESQGTFEVGFLPRITSHTAVEDAGEKGAESQQV